MTEPTPLPMRVLLPVANPATAEELVRVAASLLDPKSGTLTALGIVEVPEEMPLSEGAARARQARRLLQRVLEYVPAGTRIEPIVRIGRRAADGILEVAHEEGSDLVVFGWAGTGGHGMPRPGAGLPAAPAVPAGRPRKRSAPAPKVVVNLYSPTIDAVLRDAPCDIAVVKQRGTGPWGRVLVPVRGGPHAELALRFAAVIAERDGAALTVMHLLPSGSSAAVRAQAEKALGDFVRRFAPEGAVALVRETSNVRSAILREAGSADLLVMGASAVDAGNELSLVGSLPEEVAERASCSVVVVRTRERIGRQTFERLAARADTLAAVERAAEASRSVPARVDRWFGESNFHHAEFDDLERLVALKERRGVTVSLVLPALNEAETIGPIVARARRDLMERLPLVDELLVIDSASTDDTVAIAVDAGARVALHPEVLARYGSYRGKGEALWKSLYETTGDIVAWCDTDVRDWSPRMAYGTIGPLLEEPRLQYVKGYYQRPIVEGGILREGGGGRVTELVARPLINLFFPELSGFIQPLAGEYAGRRTLLESIPFFTGYAVEIGHLVDALERVGLDGLGQVDLDRRVHRNQDLEGLSRMSFVILQAAMRRLEERHRARLFAELGSTMKLPRSDDDRLSLEVIE
ncbi:MAG: glucosyl-3-phosphoglycerate synthase, partial [Chloroflexi bacterium]|nr:glucosyl-3-phosphoglycerate synthase [Chloroflexota bacterium]